MWGHFWSSCGPFGIIFGRLAENDGFEKIVLKTRLEAIFGRSGSPNGVVLGSLFAIPSSVLRSLWCYVVLLWSPCGSCVGLFFVIYVLSLSGLRFVVSLSVFVLGLSVSLSLSLSSLCLLFSAPRLLSHLSSSLILSYLILSCPVLS